MLPSDEEIDSMDKEALTTLILSLRAQRQEAIKRELLPILTKAARTSEEGSSREKRGSVERVSISL